MRTFSRLLIFAALLSGCGQGSGTKPGNPLQATLDFIRGHGFPSLASLKPSLPPQLARLAGVQTDATGLPAIPDDLTGATFGDDTAAINGVLGDARGLSAQGFSEARRLEAMVQNMATPIYDLLGRTDLFSSGDPGPSTKTSASMLVDPSTQGSQGAPSVFDDLANSLSYAIDTGGANGVPSYIVLAADAATGSIDISGLWPDAGNFKTGFRAKVRLGSLDDLDVALTLAPSSIGGLVPGWKERGCAEDLWQVDVKALGGGQKSLEVRSHECPGARDAVSSLSLASLDGGTWGLTGGFAQSFDDSSADTLRGFLGKRQGFVVQAASPSALDRLAAAAAVLGESDFGAPTQEKIDQFGIGQLVARYFQTKYFSPRVQKAKKGTIFTNYDNVAYWTCYADGVSDVVENQVPTVKNLCAGSDIDVDDALGVLTSLNDAIKGVGLVPGNVKSTVKALVDVLTIRNTLFVGGDSAVAYKTPPDEAFGALDDKRKQALPAALGDTAWKEGASHLLLPVKASEVPDSPYKALAGGISKFLKSECQALVGDAASKAGKAADAIGVCG